MMKASALSMKMDLSKAAAFAPAVVAAPAFASTDVSRRIVGVSFLQLTQALTTMPLSLEVTFAAYLAVLLGTFVPVTFLIVLYSQSEARKAGVKSGSRGL